MRSRFFVLLAAAGCAVSGQFVASASTTPQRPAPVHALAAYQSGPPVHLTWTNPARLDRVVVRYARGAQAPATPTDGRALHLTRATAQSAVLDHLAAGAKYSVSVWTQRAHLLSKRVTTSFTTKAPAQPLATISGVVTDTAGHALAGAEIDAYDLARYDLAKTVHTDRHGMFRMRVPAGGYDVDADGTNATGGTSDATGYTYDSVSVHVTPGATRDVRLSMQAGSALEGTVTDENGHPLSGVDVTWQPPTPYLQPDGSAAFFSFIGMQTEHTDAQGRYTLKGLSSYTVVPCFTPTHAAGGSHDRLGYRSRCATEATMPPASGTVTAPATELAPLQGALLTGTVRDANGRPVRFPQVSLEQVNGYDFEYAQTDQQGNYRMAGLSGGRWRLCAGDELTASAFASAGSCRTVTVRKNAHTVANARLGHGAALSGRLVDPSGHGVNNVNVYAEQVQHQPSSGSGGFGDAVTDSRGDYTIGSLPPGRYEVCYETPRTGTTRNPTGLRRGCLTRKFTVAVDRDRIGADHTLRVGAAVSGTVTDASGNPVRYAYVDLERPGGGYGGGTNARRDGTFDVAGLEPGRYRVCAYSAGSFFSEQDVCLGHAVDVTAGHTLTGIDLHFGTPTVIRVKVTDAAGHGLDSANVVLLRACPSGYCEVRPVFGKHPVSVLQSTMTGPHGLAGFESMRPGKYAVCVLAYYATTATDPSPTGYADKCTGQDTFTVTATAGTTTPVSLTLDQGGTVTGRVTDAAGHGLRHVAIHLTGSPVDDLGQSDVTFVSADPTPSPDPSSDIFTDGHGRYSIHSVQPGDQPLCGRKPGYARGCLAAPVTITGGAVTTAPRLVLSATTGAFAPQRVTRRPAANVLRFTVLDGRIVAVRH